MQYYLTLKPEIPKVYFESSEFPNASDQLVAIAKQLGLANHFKFFSFAAQSDLCPPEHRQKEVPWFDAQIGIDWLNAMSKHIRSDPASVPDAESLLSDFAQCSEVLRRAKDVGSKWHLAMDI
ncbi:MAG TPA: hypothetical protein VH518_24755 [Tepidisphaeraceae bacterium]